jgi:hypothetical protein
MVLQLFHVHRALFLVSVQYHRRLAVEHPLPPLGVYLYVYRIRTGEEAEQFHTVAVCEGCTSENQSE